MPREKSKLYNLEGFTGNTQKKAHIPEDDSFFSTLYEAEDGCPECGFEEPLILTKRGWKCKQCRTIVIPQ